MSMAKLNNLKHVLYVVAIPSNMATSHQCRQYSIVDTVMKNRIRNVYKNNSLFVVWVIKFSYRRYFTFLLV